MEETNRTLNLRPNVIDGEELKDLLDTVFSQMALHVARTYGPFGENTIYQEGNRMLITKDGWNVEQGVLYSKNVLASMVRTMIMDVSRAINTRAGDGTSTGLIAANEINRLMVEYKENSKIHSKFLAATIMFCVEKICRELERNKTAVTDDNMEDIIYRVALVSLDWDREFAGYIRDVYKHTGNTVIQVQNSGTEHSYVEYRDGYDISAKLLSEFKVNNAGERRYNIKNPIILLFSYTINASMFEPLLTAATSFGVNLNQELVVIAPNFEKDFRDAYKALCIRMTRDQKPLPNLTIVRYFADYNIEQEMLVDFCFLTGATNIAKEDPTPEEIIREFTEISKQLPPRPEEFVKEDGTVDNDAYEAQRALWVTSMKESHNEFIEKMAQYVGECEELEVDTKRLVVSGFGGLENTPVLETRIKTIQAEVDKAMKDMNAKSIFTDEIKLKMIRLGKLRLKMGIIYVGGFGEGQLKAKRDALDDAINACANAYTEGVVTGGNVSIPVAIEKLRQDLHVEIDGDKEVAPDTEFFKEALNFCTENGFDNISSVIDVLAIIQQGFINTWEIMMMNRYPDGVVDDINIDDYTDGPASLRDIMEANKGMCDKVRDVLNVLDPTSKAMPDVRTVIWYCINNKKPWNLITKKLDDSIIHPVRVETEVVKGCLNLVLTTTTTNQLIYNGYDDVDKELEGMREVKE